MHTALHAIAAVRVLLPVTDEEEAEDHATEVGDVGHLVAGRGQGREQFYRDGAEHHPLCLDGNGDGNDEHLLVREHHAEGQQQGIDGARSTDGGEAVELDRKLMHDREYLSETDRLIETEQPDVEELGNLLHDAGTDAAENVIKNEALRTPYALHHRTEHPKHKHVEDDMLPSTMHEHIGDELENVEVLRHEEVQTTQAVEVDNVHLTQHQHRDECKEINDEQVAGNDRYSEHNCKAF